MEVVSVRYMIYDVWKGGIDEFFFRFRVGNYLGGGVCSTWLFSVAKCRCFREEGYGKVIW